jgi:hypothetical protein
MAKAPSWNKLLDKCAGKCIRLDTAAFDLPRGSLKEFPSNGKKVPTQKELLDTILAGALKGDWFTRRNGKMLSVCLTLESDLAIFKRIFETGKPQRVTEGGCVLRAGFAYDERYRRILVQ